MTPIIPWPTSEKQNVEALDLCIIGLSLFIMVSCIIAVARTK